MTRIDRLSIGLCLLPILCGSAVGNYQSSEVNQWEAETASLLTRFPPGRSFIAESATEGLTGPSLSNEVLPHLIPRTLLFNYKIDLLAAKDDEMTFHEKTLRDNMKRTVQFFQNITGNTAEVEMWDDQKCLDKFVKLQMQALAFDFAREFVGSIRSDLCRLLMLHTVGGYYFDTDIAPVAGMEKLLDPRATFVTVRATEKSGGGGGFFQAFVAATPKHPLITRALRKFQDWYDIYWTPGENRDQFRQSTARGNVGCALLQWSFEEWSASKSTDPLLVHQSGHVSQFFEEGQFAAIGKDLTPKMERYWSNDLCDWAVIDRRSDKVVMISRIYNAKLDQRCDANVKLLGINSA